MRLAILVLGAMCAVGFGSISAQSLGTDLIVFERSNDALLRVPVTGPVFTIGTGYAGTGAGNGLTMDAGNQDVVLTVDSTATGGHLLRINVATGLATTIATGLGRVWNVHLDQNGDYFVGQFAPFSSTSLFSVRRDGSGFSTIASTFRSAPVMAQDMTSGDYIIGHNAQEFHRYSFDLTTVKSTITHSSQWTYAMAQDPQMPYVYVAAAQLVQLDTGSDTVTTLDPTGPGTGLAGRAIEVDRAPAASGALIYAGTNLAANSSAIMRFDRSGTNLGTVYSSPTSYVQTAAFVDSRNLAGLMNTPPNDRFISVSFPSQVGKSYVLAFSLTGSNPGVPLSDGRVVPLTPDSLTSLTTTQSLPPLLTNNIGVLGAGGSAQARLNLNPLGTAVNGVRLWAVAITLDPAAPLGIGEISRPLLIVL